MELRTYLNLLRRRIWLIVVTMIIGGLVAYGISNTEAKYAAHSTIYVGNSIFQTDDLSLDAGRNATIAGLAQTFARMIDSEPIAQAALERLGFTGGAGTVVANTDATVEVGTTLIRITYEDTDPARARDIANALAFAFEEGVQEFEPGQEREEGDVPALPAYVFEEAQLPDAPVPTSQLRNTILGALLGLLMAVGLVLLLDYVDVTAKTAEDIESRLELPVLGIIPASRDLARGREAVEVRG